MVLWIRHMAMEITAIVMNWNMVLHIAMIMLMDMDTFTLMVSTAKILSNGQFLKQKWHKLIFQVEIICLKILQSSSFLINWTKWFLRLVYFQYKMKLTWHKAVSVAFFSDFIIIKCQYFKWVSVNGELLHFSSFFFFFFNYGKALCAIYRLIKI